jgi:hypothetical protein
VTRRGTSRAEAVPRAHEAKAQRDAARRQHETDVEAALADYYQATAEVAELCGISAAAIREFLAKSGTGTQGEKGEDAPAARAAVGPQPDASRQGD